jgi:hypothetical protein
MSMFQFVRNSKSNKVPSTFTLLKAGFVFPEKACLSDLILEMGHRFRLHMPDQIWDEEKDALKGVNPDCRPQRRSPVGMPLCRTEKRSSSC